MASKTGICYNVAGCTLAYSKKPITIEDPAEFRCPECSQPLQELGAKSSGSKAPLVIVGVVVFVAIFGAGGFFLWPKFASKSTPPPPTPRIVDATPEPNTPPVADATPNPSTPPPFFPSSTPVAVVTPDNPPGSSTPPPEPPRATPPPELPASTPVPIAPNPPVEDAPIVENKEETADVKKDVLKRIDALPNISAGDRNKLYAAVDRARGMSKVAIIPFEVGKTSPSAKVIATVVERLHTPDVQKKLADPTVVLIILGYADSKGDDKSNLKISTDRAENLSKILQNQGKVMNIMRPVGMGSSSIFGKQQLEKNRVAEVWVVLP